MTRLTEAQWHRLITLLDEQEARVRRQVGALEPEGPDADLRGADASHAWVSVWCGEGGWIDFDPTNDLIVSDGHAVLAWGRDYTDVSPVRGILLGGGPHDLDVAVRMRRLDA